MEYRKNDLIQITIEDMGHNGEGIGKVEGFTVFIKDAVIGDIVEAKMMKVKKNYAYARLIRVLTPSADRVEPKCTISRQCGGCQLQSLSYEKQLEFKANKVINNLKHIGGFSDIPFDEMIGMEFPYRYRNKAQFPIRNDKEGNIVTGFYAGHTHTIIPNRNCYLGVEINEEILNRVIDYMNICRVSAYDESAHKGLVRHVLIRYGFATREIMVCIIINGKILPKAEILVKSLTEIAGMKSITINRNEKKTNVIMGEDIKLLWGQPYITDYIGDIKYQISPLSFYQVNPKQTQRLYGKALEYAKLTGEETVWDLYCGIGTISLFLAQRAKKVYGIEIVSQAIEDAKQNAKINNIRNVEFYVGKAEEVLPEKYKSDGIYADVIVVDPPRKGCDAMLLATIVNMQPKRVVYVSCDSATLARDLKWLCERGYEMEKVAVIDQFGQGVHVETVCLLSKLHSDKHIEVEINLDEMDLTASEKKATYEEIKAYVKEKAGLSVSSLYIAQVKQKYGIIERENFNKAKSEDAKQPKCPPEKEKAIMEALKYFGMI